MKLRTQTVRLIIVLLVVSLTGLLFLQYNLLSDAVALKEQTFRQNVHAAMNNISERLEASEAVGKVFKIIMNTHKSSQGNIVRIDVDTTIEHQGVRDSLVVFAGVKVSEPPLWIERDTIRYKLDKPQHVKLRVYDALGRQDTVLVDSFLNTGEHSTLANKLKHSKGEYFYKLILDSTTFTMQVNDGDAGGVLPSDVKFERKQQLVGKVIENLSVAEREPIERRINPVLLDSIIKQSLHESGIELPYEFGVRSDRNDSLRIVQPANYSPELKTTEFKNRLFPSDFLFSTNQLLLFFHGQKMFMLRQVSLQLALTVVLMTILIVCFVVAVRTIIKQKLFAVRLTDFINNMTHEFKTPISTISVATETIMREDVIENKEKVQRYGNVIRDENLRMKKQVDKILQMAVIEEGDFDLKRSPVDIHELIQKATANIALQVEAKQGSITYSLDALHSVINAESVHIENILHNILDNANKYSPEKPEIVVRTSNEQNHVVVKIEDKGIGISEEELKKVFDKYYRVPTGNRHDVKGFGLGLSYVKLMMNAHGGDVTIASEPGKGTTVTLTFPLLNSVME